MCLQLAKRPLPAGQPQAAAVMSKVLGFSDNKTWSFRISDIPVALIYMEPSVEPTSML